MQLGHYFTAFLFFFLNDTATTEIYTLSLHDALPISEPRGAGPGAPPVPAVPWPTSPKSDRKSTRLNSSHPSISYAVFCLKKKTHRTQTLWSLAGATSHTLAFVCFVRN